MLAYADVNHQVRLRERLTCENAITPRSVTLRKAGRIGPKGNDAPAAEATFTRTAGAAGALVGNIDAGTKRREKYRFPTATSERLSV